MKKPAFLSTVVVAVLLAVGVMVQAQQQTKQPRIGFLFIGSKDQPHMEKFRQGMRDLGYVEGKNILIEYRYAEGNADAVPGLAAELVALNLDVILSTTPAANRALLQATSTIPIVSMAGSLTGLVKSLALSVKKSQPKQAEIVQSLRRERRRVHRTGDSHQRHPTDDLQSTSAS